MSRSVTVVPGCASAWSLAAAVPRATSTRRARRESARSRPATSPSPGPTRSVFGRRRRERAEHHRERSGDPRGRRPPVGREERDPVRPGRLVQEVQRAALTRFRATSRESCTLRTSSSPSSVIPALERDGVRRRREHAVAQEDAARAPVGEREVVAVHADRRRLRGQPSSASRRPSRAERSTRSRARAGAGRGRRAAGRGRCGARPGRAA